ncbi:carboxy-S-adenosyl-L-methionine synthase CmoA [Halieaceae bacterium IMCC14734]|uniref:Carboxy-S-adenosyl-L-methionine synthase n=1 Tax=Candidatus Litorirhabdus singularis TaxID=2518993 RepID=A0ABT3TJ17_9GAMM|nr:carboxy-S-adenosyl-L-methionine synthase CmoA [Candidatus Litorirhabdus singularis]MCX2982316.1 carboxy-S-adenosyl-L-methionine synthase CmoA [Candidatus Litorirhabdus singularis]
MTDTPDTIYANPVPTLRAFAFDSSVVEVFPDMIKRSVPGYTTIIAMTGMLAGKYTNAGARCYDLGCSLGASSLAMRQNIKADGCKIIGVDNSPEMIERCRSILDTDTNPTPVELLCADVQDITVSDAKVVVLNFTLQFIPVAQRDALIRNIYAGLEPGGVMILSEKVSFADPHLDQLNIELHHQFKQANGYSELEVAQKRSAIEDVLIPETLDQHRQRIAAAGFSSCDVWFQCFNFASLIALK